MPTIKRSAPLLEEGEYCGQIRRVKQDYVKSTGTTIFRVPLHLPDGRSIQTVIRFQDNTLFVIDQLIKSTGLLLPDDGSDYQLTPDDLENMVAYFAVQHAQLVDGRTVANCRFHSKSYAIAQNPDLAAVKFPNTPPVRRLRAVEKMEEPPTVEKAAPPEAEPPQVAAQPARDDLGELTPAEYEEALAYAQRLRKERANPNPPVPAR
jgi:hypothetical protein